MGSWGDALLVPEADHLKYSNDLHILVNQKNKTHMNTTNTPTGTNDNITHPQLVSALVKPDDAILDSLEPGDCNLWHMSSCICGEAGELFDAIKKHVIYRKELDRENIVEELGDLEFYLEVLRQEMQISREETVNHNIAKLSERYHKLQYSDQHAQERADKVQKMHGVEITEMTGFEWDRLNPSRVITNWGGFSTQVDGLILIPSNLMTKEQFDKRAVFCTQVPIASKEGYLASKEG